MKAALYEEFGGPIVVTDVADPGCPDDGCVIAVKANGVCRSDWWGWRGHDPEIRLPHVPGHECAGEVVEVGASVRHWKPGDQVIVPFSSGCGHCPQCGSGNQQVCDNQYQPGFTGWGAFAELVAVRYADQNLIRLPDTIGFVEGASLGCRFMTAFRGVVHVGGVRGGEWVAVHGCGGIGLSAVMIASAMGAKVIGVDVSEAALARARELGAVATVNAVQSNDVASAIADLTGGGASLSLDALGGSATMYNSVACLAKRGRHVQIGLVHDGGMDGTLPMALVIGKELQILGSHGMQAHRYPEMLAMIEAGRLTPKAMISGTVTLSEGAAVLRDMSNRSPDGVVVIDRFTE